MANPHKLPLPKKFGRTVEKVTRIDKEGRLYYLDYDVNYYQLEGFIKLLVKPQCSTFLATTNEGDHLFARNYDFRHFKYNHTNVDEDFTGLNIVVHCKNPWAKYESIGVADGFWLDVKKGRYFEGVLDDGVTDISPLALIPYVCMDGMNSAGLGVSIMHLPTENDWIEIEYKEESELTEEEKKIAIILDKEGEMPKRLDIRVKHNAICLNIKDKKAWKANKHLAVHQKDFGKKLMLHPVLMRYMLDKCANVEEAIKLAKRTNIMSPLPDNDYHIMVSDKSGNSAILEWVKNKLIVTYTPHGTNYYLAREDHYGYGHDRDEIIKKVLDKGVLSEKETLDTLIEVAQDYRINKYVGFTLWTSLYNLDKKSVKVYQFMDYEHPYEFKLDGGKKHGK